MGQADPDNKLPDKWNSTLRVKRTLYFCPVRTADTDIKRLAPELFFILAHPVYKI